MTVPSSSCPCCKAKTIYPHCTNPQCGWWKCRSTGCNSVGDRRGRIIDNRPKPKETRR